MRTTIYTTLALLGAVVMGLTITGIRCPSESHENEVVVVALATATTSGPPVWERIFAKQNGREPNDVERAAFKSGAEHAHPLKREITGYRAAESAFKSAQPR